jgi:acyl-coenzyme A thioesterase PaaI-like protein
METSPSQSRLSTAQQLLSVLKKLSAIPGGRFISNRVIASQIPYSATIGARLVVLEPGYAKFVLKDRKSIRNHLDSIHAVALTNFGELTSGLALNTGLPASVRAIVTRITTDYLKKARGTLVAECRCELPTVTGDMEYPVEAIITDRDQDIVAKVKVLWRLGLRQEQR